MHIHTIGLSSRIPRTVHAHAHSHDQVRSPQTSIFITVWFPSIFEGVNIVQSMEYEGLKKIEEYEEYDDFAGYGPWKIPFHRMSWSFELWKRRSSVTKR